MRRLLLLGIALGAIACPASKSGPGEVRTNPRDDAEQVVVPAGTFMMGTTEQHGDLAAKTRNLLESEDVVVRMGKTAHVEFEAKYMAQKNYRMLMEIYEMAIRVHQKRG